MDKVPHTTDARRWAEEFNAMAVKLGYQSMDEGWLMAWFANAIMSGYGWRRRDEPRWQTQDTAPRDGSWFVLISRAYDSNGEKGWGQVDAVDDPPSIVRWERNEWTDGEAISHEPNDKFFWLPIPPYPLPTWSQYQEARYERDHLAREMEAEVLRVRDRIMYGS